MYNFEPLFDPAVPLAKKIEVINQVRNDPLFLCRYAVAIDALQLKINEKCQCQILI